METTTIKLQMKTKESLDSWRERGSETYDEVIQKVLFIAKNVKQRPQLSREAVEAIERARERVKSGQYLTEAQARRRLGL